MTRSLLVVCDDAGFASVDRGILTFVERTNAPICAEYLIEQEGAAERAQAMSRNPLVSVGLHFELTGMADAARVARTNDLKAKNTTLGEQRDIQAKAATDTRRQLALFREALGKDPAHVSTHGDFNVDASGAVMPWWIDLMHALFGNDIPAMQWKHPILRHNKYSWNLPATKRDPMTPDEFEALLREQTSDVVEFVMHPALPQPSDPALEMLFTAEMRIADLEAAIAIVQSDAIQNAGYRIISAASIRI